MTLDRTAMAKTLSNEFRLALACAAWPPSQRRVEAVRSAVRAGIDWPKFCRVVRRQRIWGLVHDGLTRAGAAVPPQAEEIAARASQLARDNLAMAAETIHLQRAFDAAGIAACFFKGATLAQLAYGGLGLRHARDLDLLVEEDKAQAAHALMEQLGYRRDRPPPGISPQLFRLWLDTARDFEFVHAKSGIRVELHWRLQDNPYLQTGISMASPMRPVQIATGGAVRTFGEAPLFAYLCAHGAWHGWSRLKWLADIGALLAGKSEAEITALVKAAQGGRAVDQALLLCERLFGVAVPPALRAVRGRTTRWLAAIALKIMTRGDGEEEIYDMPFGTTLVRLSQILLGTGWRFYLAQLRFYLTDFDDAVAVPLPSPLYFLYPILRLPLWAWNRARRAGR